MRVFNVRLFRAILVTATLVFWLAGSNHCRLEQLPGMEFLACAPTDCAPSDDCESSDCGGHEDSGCADDACADDSCSIVEGAVYQAGTLRFKADAPTFVAVNPALAALTFTFIAPSPAPIIFSAHTGSPPELPRLWQFAQRAAAPPRAPSFQV
jgi:hypothetical protein